MVQRHAVVGSLRKPAVEGHEVFFSPPFCLPHTQSLSFVPTAHGCRAAIQLIHVPFAKKSSCEQHLSALRRGGFEGEFEHVSLGVTPSDPLPDAAEREQLVHGRVKVAAPVRDEPLHEGHADDC